MIVRRTQRPLTHIASTPAHALFWLILTSFMLIVMSACSEDDSTVTPSFLIISPALGESFAISDDIDPLHEGVRSIERHVL